MQLQPLAAVGQGADFAEAVWQGPGAPHPAAGALAIYRIFLPEFAPFVADLHAVLLPDEATRAARYHRLADRHRFVVVRGLLRGLLGQRTGQHAGHVRFQTSRHHKPTLAGHPHLHFNVAHSHAWALVALGPQPVGIDVEKVAPDFDFTDLLPHVFSPAEQQFVQQSPDERAAFYTLWTRKEALVKATGQGINEDFHRVPALGGGQATSAAGPAWVVRSFAVADGYRAAVACAAPLGPSPIFYHLGAPELALITA